MKFKSFTSLILAGIMAVPVACIMSVPAFAQNELEEVTVTATDAEKALSDALNSSEG